MKKTKIKLHTESRGASRRDRALSGFQTLVQELRTAEAEIEADLVATQAAIGELQVVENDLEEELLQTARVGDRLSDLVYGEGS